MELWIEVVPSTKRERVFEKVAQVRELVDAVFVPEAPLGYPRAHAIAVAHLVKEFFGLPALASIRTRDINANALVSLLGAALILGLDGVVVTRGDPPVLGRAVEDIGTEDAIKIARSDRRLKGLKLGVIVSLAKSYARISERLLGMDIDFALVTRLWSPEQVRHEVFEKARKRGIKIVPYVVVSKESDRDRVFKMLRGHQRVFTVEEVEHLVKDLEGFVDGVVITAPASFVDAIQALSRASRRA